MKNLYQPLRRKIPAFLLSLFFIACFQTNASAYQLMSTNFYIVDNSGPTLMDGNITIYDNQYSNAVDWNDGTKFTNYGENWGLIRDGVSLVVERRQLVTGADTANFNMWGMQLRNYRFEISMENFDPLTTAAYIKDYYLNTITAVSMSSLTTINFSVDNNPQSKSKQRFKLIYTTPQAYAVMYASLQLLPVTITDIHAVRSGEQAKITWPVENEISMNCYQVEKSVDGINFSLAGTVKAVNSILSHSYSFTDKNAGKAAAYYRVKAVNSNGKSGYTTVVKINELNASEAMTVSVYPNPVVNKTATLSWNNAATGEWTISLVFSNGSVLPLKTQINSSSQMQSSLVLPANLPAGIYTLSLKNPAGKTSTKTIIVL